MLLPMAHTMSCGSSPLPVPLFLQSAKPHFLPNRCFRLWTHGYDIYTPSEPIVFHDYAQSMELLPGTMKRTDALGRIVNSNPNNNVNSPMEWLTRGRNNIYRRQLYENSLRRLSLMLGLDQAVSSPTDLMALTHYGLGPKRSLSQLMSFTGIDLKRKRIAGDRCVELHWVPYSYDQGKRAYFSSSEGFIWRGREACWQGKLGDEISTLSPSFT